MSRDPAAEMGGVNLYNMVRNRLTDQIDPLGLRPLMDVEAAFLEYFFGRTLDTSTIDVDTDFATRVNGRAWSPYGGNIRLPKDYFTAGDPCKVVRLEHVRIASVFAHEATHVWQRQHYGSPTLQGIYLQPLNSLGIINAYTSPATNEPAEKFRQFARGNSEQQGQIVQDMVFAELSGLDTAPFALIRQLLDPM